MGIRETLNENPRITTGITVALIVIVLAWLLWPRGGAAVGTGTGGTVPDKAFYTIDDGKTWFVDDAKNVPPFKKDNQDAVRAVVYRCGGKEFVNHMERFTPETKKQLEAMYAKADAGVDPATETAAAEVGLEVKSPGTGAWVKATDPKAQQVMQPKCPDGKTDGLEVVRP